MMKFKSISIALIIVGFISMTSIAQQSNQWPIFRGNPALSGYSKARISEKPQLLWSFQTDDAIIAAPVIADG